MSARPVVVAIVLAAGAGERLGGGVPKALAGIAGRPMVAVATSAAAACPEVTELIVAAPASEAERNRVREALEETTKPLRVISGGASRQASVRCALAAVPAAASIVVVHDAARPLATSAMFSWVIDAIARGGDVAGAIPVVPVVDTLKRVADGFVVETVPRADLHAAQTPQAFSAPALRAAHERAERAAMEFTDDAALLEWAGERVVVVPGDPANLKVTTSEDVRRAEASLAAPRAGGIVPPQRARTGKRSRHG